MAIVNYREDEIPPATEEELAEMAKWAETDPTEEELAEMPAWDELDFKYSISGPILSVLTHKEKSELGRRLLAMKEAERAELAHRARLEAERDGKAIVGINTEKPVAVHS